MYFKLALKNVKKSYKDYFIYFLTLMFSVAIFYTFNSFEAQGVVLDLKVSQKDSFVMLAQVMQGLSVVIAAVCGFLILYANQFLIKRRKKELGLYMVLGMKSSEISKILVYETFCIGIFSLLSGLGIGYVLSQFFTLLSANMLMLNVNFHFVFSLWALVVTMFSFLIIFIVVALFNTKIINSFQLIDLLKADRKNQESKLKHKKLSYALFVVSLLALAGTYYIGLEKGLMMLPQILILGSLGTLLFYFSLSTILLGFAKARKKSYYKGIQMFSVRQISNKLNSTFLSISVICLMLLVAMGALSTGMFVNDIIKSQLTTYEKLDVTFVYNANYQSDYKFTPSKYIDVNEIKESYSIKMYNDYNFSIQSIPGVEEQKDNDALDYVTMAWVPLSEYNQILKQYGHDEMVLKGNELAILSNTSPKANLFDQSSKGDVNVFGKPHQVIFDELPSDVSLSLYTTNYIGVMQDDAIPTGTEGMASWSVKLKDSSQDEVFAKTLNENIWKDEADTELSPRVTTSRSQEVDSQLSSMLIITYIGLYLGVIFLLTSVVILSLQQLSETSDNIKRYNVLKKMGVSQKELNRSLLKQTIVYFFAPMSLALVHTYFGLKVVLSLMELVGIDTQSRLTLMFSIVFMLVIYVSYFLLTYFSSKKMIKD